MPDLSFKSWMKDFISGKVGLKLIKLHDRFRKPSVVSEVSSGADKFPTSDKQWIIFISDVNGLGDAIMFRGVLMPFVKSKCSVVLVCKNYHLPAYYDLGIKQIFTWENISKNPGNFWKLLKRIRFDKCILHHLNFRSYKLSSKVKANSKYIVVSSYVPKEFEKANVGKVKNIWEVYSSFMRSLGYNYDLVEFKVLNINEDLPQKEYIVLHLGSGSLCKQWSFFNFIKLANLIKENTSFDVVFLLGPYEKRMLFDIRYIVENFKVIIEPAFSDLVSIVKNAKLVICHNTSILHLCATMKTPTVSINSTYDYEFWHPYRNLPQYKDKHLAVTSKTQTACKAWKRASAFLLKKNRDGCPILNAEISPEFVFEKVLEVVKNEA
jgi:ADP-heptose:LPS heptosyltransferase